MRKIFPVLLIGALSMLFAEVFSGASQTWFADIWGVLLTFPLYLAHVLFFLWIAFKSKKTSLPQLYFFGVIFALYEALITKVLWSGYLNSAGPSLGTFLGLGIAELPILVFFYHPIMSFILPILIFGILTKKVLKGHESILRKSTKKTILITIFLILISTFIVSGNQFSLLSSNLSLIGTFLIILVLFSLSRKSDIKAFEFSKTGFIIISIYLALLYVLTFFLILPERIPQTILPYVSIVAFYLIAIFLILKSKKTKTELTDLKEDQYSAKDLVKFAIITIVAVNIAILLPNISPVILGITYAALSLIGVVIFILAIYKILKQNSAKNTAKIT